MHGDGRRWMLALLVLVVTAVVPVVALGQSSGNARSLESMREMYEICSQLILALCFMLYLLAIWKG